MKYLYAGLTGLIIGLLFSLVKCDSDIGDSVLIKDAHPDSTLIIGKADSTFTKANENIRWVREDCHKKHYPAKGKIIYVDSNGVQEPVVKRLVSDSAKIGIATIYINDTLQGELVSRKIGCKGCEPDTLKITRTDTLRITATDTLKKNVTKPVLVSDGLQVTVGYPILPWLIIGYGVNLNVREVYKELFIPKTGLNKDTLKSKKKALK